MHGALKKAALRMHLVGTTNIRFARLRGDKNGHEVGQWWVEFSVDHVTSSVLCQEPRPTKLEFLVQSRWLTRELRSAPRWQCHLYKKDDGFAFDLDENTIPVGACVTDRLFCLRSHATNTECTWELHRSGLVVRLHAALPLPLLRDSHEAGTFFVLIVEPLFEQKLVNVEGEIHTAP